MFLIKITPKWTEVNNRLLSVITLSSQSNMKGRNQVSSEHGFGKGGSDLILLNWVSDIILNQDA